MPTTKRIGVGLIFCLALLAVFFGCHWLLRESEVPEEKDKNQSSDRPSQDSGAAGSPAQPHKIPAPPKGTEAGTADWVLWLRTLSQNEQHKVLEDAEARSGLSQKVSSDWRKVKVSAGPGTGKGDVFPCKILTDYKPLLSPRMGLGVVGLQFWINRSGDSILSIIWNENAKSALLVDWNNNRVLLADKGQKPAGEWPCPQVVPNDLGIYGYNGKLGIETSGVSPLPWRKGYTAYPFALDEKQPIWFGTVFKDSPKEFMGLVCVSPKPAKIHGEIALPPIDHHIWCVYDTAQKVLLVVDHDWTWIAMIDFATDSKVLESKSAQ